MLRGLLLAVPLACAGSCRRFILISMQRSGSNYAIQTLKAHPAIGAAGELFADGRMDYGAGFKPSKRVIEAAMAPLCVGSVETVGFKWMSNQGHDENHAAIASHVRRRLFILVSLAPTSRSTKVRATPRHAARLPLAAQQPAPAAVEPRQ
jgi:hypothetical protein